jgi:hypothetical protein
MKQIKPHEADKNRQTENKTYHHKTHNKTKQIKLH